MPKLWTKSYILTLFSMFAISITMTIFMPLIPIYIKQIGANSSLAGIAVSGFTFAALIFRPLFAVLIDKYGRKPFLLLGFLLIAVGCFTYQFAAVFGVLLLIRIMHGIGYGAGSNAVSTIVADIVPPKRRGQGIGYFGFVTAASLALGPATGLMIMKATNIKTAFLVAAVIAAAGFIAGVFIQYDAKEQIDKAKKATKHSGYEKSALPASLVMLLIAFAYAAVVTYLPTYAISLGIETISHFFILYAVMLLITRIVVDKVTKKHELHRVLIPGIVLLAVSFILLAVGKTLPIFLIAAVFFAIGYGSVQPTLNAMVVAACPPQKRGAAVSTFFSALDLGIGLGALGWGIVVNLWGYASIYYGCIVFAVLAALAVVLVVGNKK